ncbi:unnamed protein product [Kuraishia capsulata CBS 1993]|uniref:C2H2-type domain-containing protein n=1 Tax=Kuraishia capsulata CBS 1993 TaxID=1382522 RepID=W6MTR2_9ASCO|nr:uncharacterized protein KUCA_T00001162001 [Kuraishia capsulata CBS 1993]CDK25195.1 unnamed protein product [Kuraishia capsulata CBS 1993]
MQRLAQNHTDGRLTPHPSDPARISLPPIRNLFNEIQQSHLLPTMIPKEPLHSMNMNIYTSDFNRVPASFDKDHLRQDFQQQHAPAGFGSVESLGSPLSCTGSTSSRTSMSDTESRETAPTEPVSPEQFPIALEDKSTTLLSSTPRKYKCQMCGRPFTTSGHLARHSRIHTGERKHPCPHEGCDARFSRQDNCMQHYKTHLNAPMGRRGKKRKP